MDISLRLRLEDLANEYAAVIDEDRLEEWPDLFADQCRYVVTNRDSYAAGLPHGAIYASSKGMLRDRVAALREANIYEHQWYRHFVSRLQVVSETDSTVSTRSNFLVVRVMHNGETTLFATGVYVDKIDVSGDKPRFVERVVVCDSDRIDTLLAIPL